jgi:hypothetical protein
MEGMGYTCSSELEELSRVLGGRREKYERHRERKVKSFARRRSGYLSGKYNMCPSSHSI